jgi:hypothetical protein
MLQSHHLGHRVLAKKVKVSRPYTNFIRRTPPLHKLTADEEGVCNMRCCIEVKIAIILHSKPRQQASSTHDEG